jgi:hypothetical protein
MRLARIESATIRVPRLGTYKRNHEKQIEQEGDVGRDEADMNPTLLAPERASGRPVAAAARQRLAQERGTRNKCVCEMRG